ncbi:hypothetical protein BHS06_29145 [Myxococcus xanthus]|uniref:phage tail protein n=1 Tax=Myxococcus xanthus TaxID=34 RepID=UPI001126FFC8|nr:tail fiber protein [Myxococcus xanthus]QDE92720.1 hypothetical protein BHS06_29145 [Myxococcus xanthus]
MSKRARPKKTRAPSPPPPVRVRALSPPRLKKPFGFEVVYQLQGEAPLRNVLLTEDRPMELRLSNVLLRDGEVIVLQTLSTVTVEDYHFLIQFKAGQLTEGTTIVEDSTWEVLREDDANTDTTNIYLAWTGAKRSLAPGETFALVFKGLHGEPEAAKTAPMLISWPEPEVEGGTQTGSPLRIEPRIPGQGDEYETEAYLILEKMVWAGRTNIPLRMDSVGPNQVMNAENAESTLVLRLTNSAPAGSQGEDVVFKHASSVNDRSFLKLKVPIGTTTARPFALCTKDQANGITRALSGWTAQAGTPNADNTVMTFTFVPNAKVTLKPGAHLEITLAKIVTGHPSGPAHLELEYGQLPDFRDGRLTIPLEKAPMMFGWGENQTNVGFGSSEPPAKLFVRNGHVRLSSKESEIQNEGALVLRSDSDDSGDDSSLMVFTGEETEPLLELTASGLLTLRTADGGHGFNHTDGDCIVGTYASSRGGWVGTTSNHPLHLFTNDGQPTATLSTEGDFSVTGRIKDKTGFVIPVGAILPFGGSSAPAGWLLCDGREVATSSYPELQAVLGSAFGSAASGKFRLPNLKKRVPVGVDTGYARGAAGGAETHTLTTQQLPAHSHGITDPGHSHSIPTSNDTGDRDDNVRLIQAWRYPRKFTSSSNSGTTGITINNAGGGQAHNIMQPYLALHYIIKH